MEKPSFSVITNDEQYFQYCKLHEIYTKNEEAYSDELDKLELLIDAWDKKYVKYPNLKPIEFLKGLMKVNDIRPKDLATVLGLSTSYISKILNKRKRLSEEPIIKLSNHFKVTKEAFNRPYRLVIIRKAQTSTEQPRMRVKSSDTNKKFASR